MIKFKQLINRAGEPEYYPDRDVLNIISENNPNFTGLDLQNKLADYVNSDLCSAIARNTHLTSLNLGYNQNEPMQNFVNIIDVVKKNQSIKSLDFGASVIDLSVAKAIVSLMSSSKTIEHIELESCDGIGQEGILEITKAVGENTTIECLGITEIGLNNDSANLFINNLRHNRNIIKLNSKEVDDNPNHANDPYYDDDQNIDPQLNNSIRELIARNNQYSIEQRKFFKEIKDDLISDFKKNQDGAIDVPTNTETSDRTLEVVNDVMNKLSDNSTLKKIRDLFLVSKSLSHLPINNLANETSVKITQDTIKLLVKNPDLLMDENEIKVVSERIYKYFDSAKKASINSLIDKPSTQVTQAVTANNQGTAIGLI
jgi:hypothetical protein